MFAEILSLIAGLRADSTGMSATGQMQQMTPEVR